MKDNQQYKEKSIFTFLYDYRKKKEQFLDLSSLPGSLTRGDKQGPYEGSQDPPDSRKSNGY